MLLKPNLQDECEGIALDKAHIQRQFDRSAASYDHVAQMQLDIARDLMALSPIVSVPNMQILDAGCGTGYGMQVLANKYQTAFMTGLDIAPAMLEIASERCANARYEIGDIERLPFSDNAFDLTWSSSAVQWCDIDLAAQELSRVTKRNGHVLISTFSKGTLQEWRNLWGLSDVDSRFESTETILKAFELAGLNIIKCETKTYTQSFSSFKQAVNSIRGLGAGNAEQTRSKGLFGVERYKQIKSKVNEIIKLRGELELPYLVTFVVASKR